MLDEYIFFELGGSILKWINDLPTVYWLWSCILVTWASKKIFCVGCHANTLLPVLIGPLALMCSSLRVSVPEWGSLKET